MIGSPRASSPDFFLCLLVACLVLPLGAALCVSAAQQSPQNSASTNSGHEQSGEMSVQEEASTSTDDSATRFRVNVRLVLTRVVVRDAKGDAVGNLNKEDFELFDDGKKQVISNFDAEHLPAASALTAASPVVTPGGAPAPTSSTPAFPSRYVAYVFDDLRLKFGDLARVREAAQRRMSELAATDRIAIFSTSGQTVLDFTDDRSKLQETLNNLTPRPRQAGTEHECPNMTMYEADLIENKHDPQAIQTAENDYLACSGALSTLASQTQKSNMAATARPFVESTAIQVLSIGTEDSRMNLRTLLEIVRRMSALPGQRRVVLVSPGFLTPQLEFDYNQLIDRALRAQIVINSLDARGLYVILPGGDASEPGRVDNPIVGASFNVASHTMYDIQSASAERDILAALSNATGGTLFQNNNDMNEGLRRLADAPESWYVLGFTPQNLKNDGKYHTLKVRLANRSKFDVQARHGYFARKKEENEAEEAKREIEDEMYSSEEMHELPVVLHTEYFKPSDDTAKLTVLTRIDVKRLRYKQEQDRNHNDLTVVTAVFDRNGNFLQANQKVVQMRWKSETLQAKLGSGITLRTSFDVKPGRYMVRVVARDTEQQGMSAENGAVEIP